VRQGEVIRILCVGDGERDGVTVPRLVVKILQAPIASEFRPWARLSEGGTGLRRKLRSAVREDRLSKLDGLVATVDADKDRRRAKLKALNEERGSIRKQEPRLPIALGEADPHLEAWLLDDPQGVREALNLPVSAEIPTVRALVSPKKALDGLPAGSPRRDERALAVLADVAARVDPRRCAHDNETGFHSFAEDVRHEFGAIGRPPSSAGSRG